MGLRCVLGWGVVGFRSAVWYTYQTFVWYRCLDVCTGTSKRDTHQPRNTAHNRATLRTQPRTIVHSQWLVVGQLRSRLRLVVTPLLVPAPSRQVDITSAARRGVDIRPGFSTLLPLPYTSLLYTSLLTLLGFPTHFGPGTSPIPIPYTTPHRIPLDAVLRPVEQRYSNSGMVGAGTQKQPLETL